jgi:predicted RNase H-like HicB family nuclease
MHADLTAVFREVAEGDIANTQGAAFGEARADLEEAVMLVLEANRVLAEESLADSSVIREPFEASA